MNCVMRVFSNRIVAWSLCLSSAIGFTSCLDDEPSRPNKIDVAYVALYHGSPDGPGLDVEVNNNPVKPDPLDYAEFTGYQRYYTGDRNFTFGPYLASNVDIEEQFTLEANKFYTIVVAGEYDEAEAILLDDNTSLPPSGKAKVRVINVSPDAGNVDLLVAGETTNWVSDLDFKEFTEFTEVDAGEFDLQVRSSGNDELLLSLPDTRLQSGYLYTIIIRGYDSPPGGNTNVLAAQIVLN